MNRFVDNFRNLETEYLLERRAMGDDLEAEAHEAIETVFKERGITPPLKPTQPIQVKPSQYEPTRSSLPFKAVILISAIAAPAIAKQTANTWIGIAFSVVLISYYGYNWIRRQGLTDEQRESEDARKQSEDEAVPELSLAAARGDLIRVKELILYKSDVNEQSLIGSTALMYAARNNYPDIVSYLIQSGADTAIQSAKGNTALSFALKYNNAAVVALLKANPSVKQ